MNLSCLPIQRVTFKEDEGDFGLTQKDSMAK